MTQEVEEKNLVAYTVRLESFGISDPLLIKAESLSDAYVIALRRIVDGVMYVPPFMPADIKAKLSYIADQVYKQTGVSIEKMRSPIRSKEFTNARQAFCWLCKELYQIKPAYITAYINRDRSTFYNSVEQVDNDLFYPFNSRQKWVKNVVKKMDFDD